jgi:hypothetical protein
MNGNSIGEGDFQDRDIEGPTLKVTSRRSLSSNTVDRTCLPSSKTVIPTYKETFSMSLKTPSARMTDIGQLAFKHPYDGGRKDVSWWQREGGCRVARDR